MPETSLQYMILKGGLDVNTAATTDVMAKSAGAEGSPSMYLSISDGVRRTSAARHGRMMASATAHVMKARCFIAT